MNIIEFIAQDVFDKVRGRFTNLEMGDEQGSITTNSKDARFFDFDFVIEGNNLGRVSVSINELGSLKVFYSQGITEDVDTITLNEWYEFLREMRYFAKRRMLRFDTRDITKSNLNKNDFQYLAQTGTKENNMNESAMIGRGPKTSMRKLENTRLVVRHSKAIDETQKGARSRNISALYIENADGERFKYPFIHLAGAKAMQRHVANGGRPYDDIGGQIINLSEKVSQLVSFKRHVGHHDGMNQEVNEILSRSQMKLNELRKVIEGLAGQKYYESWCETLQPNEDDGFVLDQATMEDYKDKFTQKNFKEDLTQYFPLIHTIMQETGEIDLTTVGQQTVEEIAEEDTTTADEFAQFESWTMSVAEGTLEPDTIMALKDLIDNGLSFGGPDATGAIEALQGIGVHNDELETALAAAAQLNPEGNPTDTILSWLMKDDPEAAAELGAGQQAQPVAQEPAMDPAAAAPAPEAPVAPEQPVAEAAEDRTSYQVAKILFDKGIKYDSAKENDLISAIGMILVKELDMSPKQARYMISYDEDFVADTLQELGDMDNMSEEVPVAEGSAHGWNVVRANEKSGQLKITKWLRKEAGLPKDAPVYFDDADLVYGDQTIVPGALVNPKLKMSDLLAALTQAAQSAPEEGEDMENHESKPEGHTPSMKEIVEFIKPFYNKHAQEQGLGEWRKGPTELGIMAGKQFGDHVGKLVEKYVEEMQAKTEAMRGQQEATMQFEAIKKLAGLSKI